jgi:hypothetical protein
MARPSAQVLAQADRGDLLVEILDAPGVFYITYRGSPCSVRTSSWTSAGLKHSYVRCAYSNPQHCRRLADKLNSEFNTQDFGMKEINGN